MFTTDVIAATGVAMAFIGGAIALYNARKAVQWKRAELANSFLETLTSNPTLVFAVRTLDWNRGRLVVPESLRPLLRDGRAWIEHDPVPFLTSMTPDITLEMMNADDRVQLYRTALDDLLSWLALVSNALQRNLFQAEDIEGVAYCVGLIQAASFLEDFIDAFGYSRSTKHLRQAFARMIAEQGNWRMPSGDSADAR